MNPQCPKCGYNLTGNESGTCPECGIEVGSDLAAELCAIRMTNRLYRARRFLVVTTLAFLAIAPLSLIFPRLGVAVAAGPACAVAACLAWATCLLLSLCLRPPNKTCLLGLARR